MNSKHLLGQACITLILITGFLCGPSPAAGQLTDAGLNGDCFHDSQTGLYWYDPGYFAGQPRGSLDMMLSHSTTWRWATSAEIDSLVGKTCSDCIQDETLEDVMGPRFSTITSGGPRWLGFYAETDPDGWLIESNDAPNFVNLTDSGFQNGAAGMGAGAWLVSSTNPLETAATLEDLGENGEFFYDHATNLYWKDPAAFHDMTRVEMEDWLAANPDWRWATSDEVYALAGKSSTDGTPLDAVVGERFSTVTSGGPRWLGLYADSGSSGILLQADIGPGFYVVTQCGPQVGAEALGAGAWMVRATDPTPVASKTWGDLKANYR